MNLRPGLYAQRCLSFVLLLLWWGFASSASDLASLLSPGASLFTPFVATSAPLLSASAAFSAPLVSAFRSFRASFLTPFRALRASFLTPLRACLRGGWCWGGCLCLGLSLRRG
jgi:hypothetical protein